MYVNNAFNFKLEKSTQIDPIKIRTNDFYKLHKDPQKWNNYFLTKENVWKKRLASFKIICKEPKLKEFQFKFIHRIIIKKDNYNDYKLFQYVTQSDNDCIYYGDKDSINHTF